MVKLEVCNTWFSRKNYRSKKRRALNNMNSILITGCNRGLGLGLVKQLLILPKPAKYIFATCRNPDQASVKNKLII